MTNQLKACSLLLGLVLAGCSQLTTSAAEEESLRLVAADSGSVYLECLTSTGFQYAQRSTVDVPTAVKMAGDNCTTELDTYSTAQEEYLSANFMITEAPLQEAVAEIEAAAALAIGQQLVDSDEVVVLAAVPAAGSGASSAEQSAYLNCMDQQALKYAVVDDSAAAIADVADNRCKSQLDPAINSAAIRQEGRAQAMAIVLDTKLAEQEAVESP
jgi:hypothetical protein